MRSKKYCVIGLGYFGTNLALYLTEEGAEVIAIDLNSDRVAQIKDKVSLAVEADSTDIKVLKSLGVGEMDAVIVAIGEGFEASVNTTAIVQELGVKKILARVISPVHERLLRLMKVDEMLVPEAEAAKHLAYRLKIDGLIESYDLGNDYGIYEINIPKSFMGKTLIEVELRKRYSLNLVTIKKLKIQKGLLTKGETDTKQEILGVPSPDYIFNENDVLVVFGKEKDIEFLLSSN